MEDTLPQPRISPLTCFTQSISHIWVKCVRGGSLKGGTVTAIFVNAL